MEAKIEAVALLHTGPPSSPAFFTSGAIAVTEEFIRIKSGGGCENGERLYC
jgi:hypothetical protein